MPRPCVCTTVKKLSRFLGRVYDASLASSPMNVTQLAVLRCIERRKGQPLTHVAQELEMDRTSLYRALTPMQRQGWVTLTAGANARSRAAQLTREGHRALQKAGDHWEEIQVRIVREFGRRRWSVFVAEMQRLASAAALAKEGLPIEVVR